MEQNSKKIITTYLTLQFGNTLAASLIWGINTIFLLNAGLNNFEAFMANSFYTLGLVVFEIPTGIVADSLGRRTSYLLGTITLGLSTLFYYLLWVVHAPVALWMVVSLLLGLGFTFFSGAVEAWLVDALHANNFKGRLETVFGRGQIINGIAMLIGSVGGGVIAQVSNLGVPYIVRGVILLFLFGIAWKLMHDIGFNPERTKHPLVAMRRLLDRSLKNGLYVPSIRWLMLSAILLSGVGVYVFYALQPYLLKLYGDEKAYLVAGLAAALVAVAQICGGILASKLADGIKDKIVVLIGLSFISCIVLVGLYITPHFYIALGLVFIWGVTFSASMPLRQTYLNGMIPSRERATILSFDSMIGNVGGIVIQPSLARAADVWSYGTSFFIGAGVQVLALPLLARTRKARRPTDAN